MDNLELRDKYIFFGLWKALLKKGVITEAELLEAIAEHDEFLPDNFLPGRAWAESHVKAFMEKQRSAT